MAVVIAFEAIAAVSTALLANSLAPTAFAAIFPDSIVSVAIFAPVIAASTTAAVSTESSANSDAPTALAPICAEVIELPVIFAPGISPSVIFNFA